MTSPDVPLSHAGGVTLNLATRATDAAVDAALNVVGLAMDAESDGRQIAPRELRPLADAANEGIQRAHKLLLAAGGRETSGPSPSPIAIDQLRTPDTELLLSLLQRAQVVAERVDATRGRSLGEEVRLLPGESRGTDLAESISYLTLRVRTEVHGPNCGGRE